jgi:hypothetical protein
MCEWSDTQYAKRRSTKCRSALLRQTHPSAVRTARRLRLSPLPAAFDQTLFLVGQPYAFARAHPLEKLADFRQQFVKVSDLGVEIIVSIFSSKRPYRLNLRQNNVRSVSLEKYAWETPAWQLNDCVVTHRRK